MAEETKHEKFEYENIKSKLISLKENYTNYMNAVNKIDLIINTELNVSSEAALFSPQGDNILSLWGNYCSKIKGFIYIFEKWTDSIATIYNNNISFEESNPDNIKIDDVDLDIKPTTYSSEDTSLLARLMNGDSTVNGSISNGIETITIAGVTYQIIRDANGNILKVVDSKTNKETINYTSGYEDAINEKYQQYQSGNISENEWNEYVNSLPKEQREYATILSTGALVVCAKDVESILNTTPNIQNNMAENVASSNRIPEGWKVVSIDDIDNEDPFHARYEYAYQFLVWATTGLPSNGHCEKYPLSSTYETNNDNFPDCDSYFTKEGDKWVVYIDGQKYKEFTKKPTESDYKEMWNIANPGYCSMTYTDEGEQAFKSYKKSIPTIYQRFQDTGILILNEDTGIFYSDTDKCIHYPDHSVLQLENKKYNWVNNIFMFSSPDETTFKELFMTANGYITYEIDNRYNY